MIQSNIKEEHIIDAFKSIAKKSYNLSLLKKTGVLFKNDIYPLSLVVSEANTVAGNEYVKAEDIDEKQALEFLRKFPVEFIKTSNFPFYQGSKLLSQIRHYNAAIKESDWLLQKEIYKFNFIRWVETNIDFNNDSNEDIKNNIELAQQEKFDSNTHEKGVNFLTTIKRYKDDYITIDDIERMKQIAKHELAFNSDTPQFSAGSYPKASLFLSLFDPDCYSPYDNESLPAYNFFKDGEVDVPKKGLKAFQFYQIFYQNIRGELKKTTILNLDIFKEILQTSELTNLHWNWITQDFLLYTSKITMSKNIPAYYCVGYHFYSKNPSNQLPRFIKEGIWQNGYDDKFNSKVDNVPVGSLIAAKTTYTMNEDGRKISVLEIKQIGKVIENLGNGQTLKVEWEENFEPFKLKGKGAYRNTISRVHNQDNINAIFYNRQEDEVVALDNEEDDAHFIDKIPLNQIFFGAPGTGKTYSTKKAAVEIVDGIEYDELDRNTIVTRYNDLVKKGQIVFTTFHQSISYEDFIEGIKPETIDNKVLYEVKDGIFKHLAKVASKEVLKTPNMEVEQTQTALFDDAWDKLMQEAQSKWDNNTKLSLKTITNKSFEVIELTNQGNLTLKPVVEGGNVYTVSFKRAKKLYEAFPTLEDIKNIDQEFRAIIGGMNATAYWSVLNYLINHTVDVEVDIKDEKPNKYVLIIDEINRGNVSSVFGELITLIEEDKRKGVLKERKEFIEVQLPYSKDKFSIPDNLYILGTMNTADRSVEALDTALRRRFSFVEMKSDPYVLEECDNGGKVICEGEEIDLVRLLQAINSRIELLIDKDHQIGHSFLIDVETIEQLNNVFKNKIIPLLEEYFFGNYGKIGLVLGEKFIKPKSQKEYKFAAFSYGEDVELSGLSEKVVYEFTSSDSWDASTFISIYEPK